MARRERGVPRAELRAELPARRHSRNAAAAQGRVFAALGCLQGSVAMSFRKKRRRISLRISYEVDQR